MAKFHYDLTGAEIIYRDVPMYDAALIDQGEFIMLGSSVDTDNQFITGYTGSSAEMVDGLGISNERITTTSTADYGDHITTAATTTTRSISSIAATPATGNRYGKAIINPFAVYLTEYSQGASDDISLTSAWSTTTLTLTSLEADVAAAGWILGGSASVTAGFAGQLRYVASSSGDGSCVVLTAPTVAGTTSDSIIKILPIHSRLTNLTSDSLKLTSTSAIPSGVSLTILENYVTTDAKPLEPLRQQAHDGLNLSGNPKVYADVLIHDHVYNVKA